MSEMQRQKNVIWNPPNEWQYVNLQILMDIRGELIRLNNLLHCQNFIDIPIILREIRGHVAPKKKPARKRRKVE